MSTSQPEEILRRHPHSDPLWAGLLQGALRGDERTSANTITTVQQAMSLFFQDDIRRRCVPSEQRPATNIADIIREGGTVYLLGREDPYASASPLMTAVAEHVLDTAIQQANSSQFGRLCPPMLACLDELPSTAPLPTLRTRMANERALGLSFIYAAQTFRQLAAIFGEQEARALVGLTNVLVWFGGSKDVSFNQEVSDLVGRVRVPRSSWQMGGGRGRTIHSEEIPILRPEELRQLPDKQALVIAENARPIIARLHRCIEGRDGRRLLAHSERFGRSLLRDVTGVVTWRPVPPPPSRRRNVMAGEQATHASPLVLGFPAPGSRVQKAYHDLWEAQNGSEERKKKLGNPANLPRPWDPTTCLDRGLRWEGWIWLDQVAEWINTEYVWEASGGACIPHCWPLHPHLVHELAVVADQRRRAGHAPTSDVLENWHRYVLPGFIDRMRQRLKQSCDDDHQPWPSRSRYTRHTSEEASAQRLRAFEGDLFALAHDEDVRSARHQLTLLDGGDLIDPSTGEVF